MSIATRNLVRCSMLLLAVSWSVEPALARGGRGGGGGGRGGMGGGRPSMGRPSGGGMSRPAPRPAPRPSASASRPSFSQARPSGGGMSRPGGGVPGGRPNVGGGAQLGGIGGARPSYGHSASFPNMSRPQPGGPATRPGQIAGRPGQGAGGVATRPGQIGGRPGQLPGNPATRPGQIGGRPGQGPGGPATRPGQIGGRPGQGPATRPGQGGRPGDIGGLRPGEGGRPGEGTRPGGGGEGRPWIGGGGRPGDRPIAGNGNRPIINNHPINNGNRAIIGGNNNVNFNRYNNFNNNRAAWGMGGGRYGYGYRNGNWAGHWHDNCINRNHWGWYHGCWPGHWGNYWYAPLAFGATAWGLGALSSSWGYGYSSSYANPYYGDTGSAMAYDYSQPVSVQTYDNTAAASAPVAADPAAPPSALDQARALFMTGDYAGAQAKAAEAVTADPKDPVAHEFYALCLFAQGNYKSAASVLDSLLAAAPGMDWTTMVSLYPSQKTYLQQFSSLEDYCQANPQDPASHFVLAYHLLVRGEPKSAIAALEVVVANQPKDVVATRLLAALKGEDAPAASDVASAPASHAAADNEPAVPKPEGVDDAGPTTDLTGNWEAKRDDNQFQLKIDEAGKFVWTAKPAGANPIELNGDFSISGDLLNLETKDQGVMAGRVKSLGADNFQFIPIDSPPGDSGLNFLRQK